MRPRPLKSDYTQELLVHPSLFQRAENLEVRQADLADAHQLIVVDESSLEDVNRQAPRHLSSVPADETDAVFGTSPRIGDFNVSDGGRYQ